MIATEPRRSAISTRVRQSSRTTWWVGGGLVLLAIGIATGIFLAMEPDSTEVRVASPTFQDLETTVSSVGKVTPIDDFQARANFSGMVEKVYVKAGQKVHPGQMLVQMKDQFAQERVDAAQAALDSARVADENIRHNGSQEDRISLAGERAHAQMERDAAAGTLDTLKQMERNGTASPSEVGAADYRLRAAEATLQTLTQRTTKRYSDTDAKSFRERVTQAQSTLAAERVSYANANIASPIAGTVYMLPIADYDFVPMGADLLRVADLDHVHIRADFDELDLGKLAVGQPVTVVWDGRPGRPWHGHIQFAPLAAVAAGPRSVGKCIVTVDDAKGDLPIGTNVTVIVTLQRLVHVLTIPREALHTEGGANFVYRVVDGKLQRTNIDVGMVNLARVEVTKGLAPGDTVALHATTNRELTNGLKVRPVA